MPWMNTNLSFHERAKLLVAELTLREKTNQLGNCVAEDVKRNGTVILPHYQYWNEAIHGVARSGAATSFPESKAMSATWDPELVYECATAISDEARIYHVNTGKGLNYWSPTINMARDPRWGREEENYGEDPFLAGSLAVQFVKGFQGEVTDSNPYYKIIATAKHYAANNYEQGRQSTTSFMKEKILREYYLPAFEMCVRDADVRSIMAAYNALSIDLTETDAAGVGIEGAHGGLPMVANKMLLTDVLRHEWGFKGYVVSDCAAISCMNRPGKHLYFGGYTEPAKGVVPTTSSFNDIANCWNAGTSEVLAQQMMEARSSSMALNAGTDMNCEFMNQSAVLQRAALYAATPSFQATEANFPIKDKNQTTIVDNDPHYVNLTEATIDSALVRILETRFALGEFDNYVYPVSNTLESEANRALALRAAQEAVVLMKNDTVAGETGAILPISTVKSVALVGPYADAIMLGDYSGSPTYTTTPFQAFAAKLNFTAPTEKNGMVPAVPFDQAVVSKRGAANNDKGAGNLENTSPGDIFKYAGVNFGVNGCTNFEMKCGAKDNGVGTVSFMLDSKDNTPFLTVNNKNTGGWTTWDTVCATLDPTVVRGTHDLYVKFSGSQSYCGNYQYFHFSNPTNPQIPAIETTGPLYMCQTTPDVNSVAPQSMIDRAVAVAQRADVVVFIGGTDYSKPADHATGTESHDRWQLTLPGNQEAIINAMAAVNPHVILVLETGSCIDLSAVKDNVAAIVEAWYDGQAQGQAICDVIYGDYNPGGKLTSTWYNSIAELPSEEAGAQNYSSLKRKGMMEYNIDDWGYTYMYYGRGQNNPCQAAAPQFAFGYGLSYTTFAISNVQFPTNFAMGSEEDVTVTVANTGSRKGAEVVQIYATYPSSTVLGRPAKKLVGFQRVELEAGASTTVNIPVKHLMFSYFDEATHQFKTEGQVTLQVATSSRDQDVVASQAVTTAAGVTRETYISDMAESIPVVTGDEVKANGNNIIYSVMGAYVGKASDWDTIPAGIYVLNGKQYIKKQ